MFQICQSTERVVSERASDLLDDIKRLIWNYLWFSNLEFLLHFMIKSLSLLLAFSTWRTFVEAVNLLIEIMSGNYSIIMTHYMRLIAWWITIENKYGVCPTFVVFCYLTGKWSICFVWYESFDTIFVLTHLVRK